VQGLDWNVTYSDAVINTTYTITALAPFTIGANEPNTVSWDTEINSVTAAPTSGTEGTPQNVTVSITTANTASGTPVIADLVTTAGAPVGVTTNGTITSNAATLTLSIPPTVADGDYKIQVTLLSNIGPIVDSSTSYTIGTLVSSLGPEGDLSIGTNVFNIQDNTTLGVRTFGIAKNRLPGSLSTASSYKLIIGSTEFTLTQNMFNANIYNYDVPDTYTADQIRNGLLVGII
jgi:hypothetical protein